MGILFEGGAELHSLCKTGGTNRSRSRSRSRHGVVAVAATIAVTIAAAPPYNKRLLATCFPAQLAQRPSLSLSISPSSLLSHLSSLQHFSNFNQDKSIQSKASKSSAGLICSAGQANYK